VAFQFKEKQISKGQYRLPFSFTLPPNLPGSFKYVSRSGERVMIKYQVEIYIEKFKNVFRGKKEFEVREFLFTEEEIDEDWENHVKISNLKHILKPVASVVS